MALDALIAKIRALRELDGVLHLYAGAGCTCEPEAGAWTHVLYGRYRDKEALDAYSAHPRHLDVVADGGAIFEDKMALDWEACVSPDQIGAFCAASRIAFVEWKQEGEDPIAALTQALAAAHPSVSHYTAGPNFSPARARGFQWGFAAQFASAKELEVDNFLKTLAHNPSIERFLYIDFATKEEPPASI